jgi:malate synthase
MSTPPKVPGVEIAATWADGYEDVLTEESLGLLARLQREFGQRRKDLLEKRAARDAELAAGALPDFLSETSDVRGGDWTVAPPAPGLVDRRVEITGPTDR